MPGAEHEHWLIGGLCWRVWGKNGANQKALYQLHGTGLLHHYQLPSIIHLVALSSRMQTLGALAEATNSCDLRLPDIARIVESHFRFTILHIVGRY